MGCADYLGNHSDLNSENLISSYWNKFSSETKIIEMVKHQEGLVDGEGANRIVRFIESDASHFEQIISSRLMLRALSLEIQFNS